LFASLQPADQRLTLAERLDRLNDTLQSLGQRLKEAMAEAVGAAVAGAVRDAVHGLLGGANEPARLDDQPWALGQRDEPTWSDSDRPLWTEDEDFVPRDRPVRTSRHQEGGLWHEALGIALQAGLTWLRHQPRRRPVLTAVVGAVAAGVAALLAGPAVRAGAGVLASTASLLLTAEALGPAPESPAG